MIVLKNSPEHIAITALLNDQTTVDALRLNDVLARNLINKLVDAKALRPMIHNIVDMLYAVDLSKIKVCA